MHPLLPIIYLYHTNPHEIMELLRYFYHPDHASTELSTSLDSSSWITDGSGNAIQHLQNFPYGEDWVDERNTAWSSRYTFSGKEKDTETGYSYFGARYYDSNLSIWLSVDPMSDKYPSMSPYNYCANNPVILVDPDGRDIWTIYEDGTINREKNTKIDRIDVVDGEGNITKGTEAKYGTIKQHTLKGNKTTIDYFEIKGDDLAKETFENIANNTSIEWTHAKVGAENSESNIVGTSHSNESTSVGHFLRVTGYTLKEVTHNHTNDIPIPSGEIFTDGTRSKDLFGAELYNPRNSSKVKLNIYTKKYGYSQYNKNETRDTRFGYFSPVIVTPR